MRALKIAIGMGMLSAAASYAAVVLNDSFVTADVGYGLNDAANGEYRNVYVNHANNVSVSGGSIVGFSSGNLWAGNSGLPIMTTTGLGSTSINATGGSVAFRGVDDSNNNYVGRGIDAYSPSPSTYFTGTLRASVLDDNAVSLIAFAKWWGEAAVGTRANQILDNSGYSEGFAFGFKGNGAGGMDLIVRCRNNTPAFVDIVLQSGISANTDYSIIGKVDWDASAQNLRDPITMWINPESATEPLSGGTTFDAFLGVAGDLQGAYLLQKNFGSGPSDAVYMDEIGLASSYTDLNVIPEPTTVSLVAFFGAAMIVIRKRRL